VFQKHKPFSTAWLRGANRPTFQQLISFRSHR